MMWRITKTPFSVDKVKNAQTLPYTISVIVFVLAIEMAIIDRLY